MTNTNEVVSVEEMSFEQLVETVKTTNDRQVIKDILTSHSIMFDVVGLAMDVTDFTLVSEDINETEERAVSYLIEFVDRADMRTLKARMVEELEYNKIYY